MKQSARLAKVTCDSSKRVSKSRDMGDKDGFKVGTSVNGFKFEILVDNLDEDLVEVQVLKGNSLISLGLLLMQGSHLTKEE